jgi:NAD(P)-dependent dehydrogenase (short-subunit alcohol dehydrogenase family)
MANWVKGSCPIATGAASGIGLASASAFYARGVGAILLDRPILLFRDSLHAVSKHAAVGSVRVFGSRLELQESIPLSCVDEGVRQ